MRKGAPKAAPFKVGTKVKYLGKTTYSLGGSDGKMLPAKFPNMVATVVSEKYGHRGTGKLLYVSDDGEKVHDETEDFYSIVENDCKVKICISLEDKDEWKIID